MPKYNGKLFFLAGPSCVGKGSLVKCLKKLYPDQWDTLKRIVPYNSRHPRPGETEGREFYFRTREGVEELARKNELLMLKVRGDLHAFDIEKIIEVVSKKNALLIDSSLVLGPLKTHPRMKGVPIVSTIVVPIGRNEIASYKTFSPQSLPFYDLITDLMRRKLLRRTVKQKGVLSLLDLEAVEERAKVAHKELQEAHHFDYVLVNHDGGDHDHWNAFYYPLGDALRTLQSFAAIVSGENPEGAENWEKGLVP